MLPALLRTVVCQRFIQTFGPPSFVYKELGRHSAAQTLKPCVPHRVTSILLVVPTSYKRDNIHLAWGHTSKQCPDGSSTIYFNDLWVYSLQARGQLQGSWIRYEPRFALWFGECHYATMSVYLNICVYLCMYVCMYVCRYIHTYIYIYTYVYICIYGP